VKASRACFVLILLTLCACGWGPPEPSSPTQLATAEPEQEFIPAVASPTVALTDDLTPTPSLSGSFGEQEVEMSATQEESRLTITILYDNNPYDTRLRTAWGFSALVEVQGGVYLFDTGGDSPTLLENMRVLEIDLTPIQAVILSHVHSDHVGGLEGLLREGIQPVVYVPPSFPTSFKRSISQQTAVVEVGMGQPIGEAVYTTGELGSSIREQALVVTIPQGLVIITGCAHPGVVSIVERAIALFNKPVYLVLGGFHLGDKSETQLESILSAFRRLGVEQVAPCHCTGERAIQMFKDEYGDDFIEAGAGRVIVVGP
jgi:7,8-dihydropterin-6-yl-methyl-4-(beta-D-ribofuranosyl)aminobenzene 5'-phosphate synthase